MNPDADDLVTRLDALRQWATVGYDSAPSDLPRIASDVRWVLAAAEAEVTRLDRARGEAAESCAAAEAERDELLAALREVASYLPAAVNRDSVDALLARMEGDR